MLAIVAIALGPWFVAARLINNVENNSGRLIKALLDIVLVGVHTIQVGTVIGTVGLSYKFLIYDRREDEAAAKLIDVAAS